MRLNTIMLTAAISIASTIPAFAHHGWGGNVDEVTAMTGVVTEGVKLAGPHGTMKIRTSDGKGYPEREDAERAGRLAVAAKLWRDRG